MMNEVKNVVIDSTVEGVGRTIAGNGKNVLENTGDVIFEKTEKSVDNFFDPLINVGSAIDRIFGW